MFDLKFVYISLIRAKSKHKAGTKRGKTCERVAIGFGFNSDWLSEIVAQV